jgi:DNA-binding XRE family transcriptional regulator
MKHTLLVTPSGEELVLLAKADFDRVEDLLDAATFDAARAADTGEAFDAEDAAKALAAPTPLAFWRAKRGHTQDQLAARVGIKPEDAGDLEAGRRQADLGLLKKLAVALRVQIEDLAADD